MCVLRKSRNPVKEVYLGGGSTDKRFALSLSAKRILTMQNLTTSELAVWINNSAPEKPVLLDVRESWEFQTCHIEGALTMPMNTIPGKLSELDEEQAIICICHHGVRSMQVALFLEQHGFTQISNLTGGVHAWAQQVDSTMPTY
jgi:rhodanese-related sulfurtransferase